MRPDDLPAACALDEAAQGAARTALIQALFAEADRAVVVERGGAVAAFGLSQPLAGERLVAPIVAREGADAASVAAALARPGEEVRLDLPDGERAVRAWGEGAGLVAGLPTTVMVRGGDLPGARAMTHALAGRPWG